MSIHRHSIARGSGPGSHASREECSRVTASPRPGRPSAATRAAALLGWLLLTGCYGLRPAEVETLSPDQRVRAHLQPAGAQRVAQVLGEPRDVLDGRLVTADSTRIALLVPSAYFGDGMASRAVHQEIRFTLDEVALVQRRVLDPVRTGVMVGVGAVVVGMAIAEILGGDHGGTTSGPPGSGGPEVRIPIRVFPVP